MPQRILGIDVGSWSIKSVILETAFRSYEVAEAREIMCPQGLEAETLRSFQIDTIRTLTQEMRADVVIGGFPGDAAITRFVSVPFSDARKVEQTIGGEVEDSLPYDLTEAAFAYEIIRKTPEGSECLCVAAKQDRVREFLTLFNEAGVDPRALPVDAIDLFNLYTHLLHDDSSRPEIPPTKGLEDTLIVSAPDGSTPIEEARLIVDVGHRRTLIAVAAPSGLANVRVLRTGGKDITAAIQKAYELTEDNASEGKHEDAQLVSRRHPAASDAAQRMSDVVAEGLQPLIQELRRTLQAVRKERKVRVARIDLLGGGSRIRNLANYLAEQLSVPVAQGLAVEQMFDRYVAPQRRAAFGGALAYALRYAGEQRVSRINLRVGPLAYAGQLQHLRARLPFLAASAATLLFLLGMNAFVQFQLAARREKLIDEEFCLITKEVVGREICEPAIALSVIKQPASEIGGFKLPERSGVQVAADLSQLVRNDLELTVDEMDITTERARISGLTKSFDAVDEIVGAYGANPCFSDIKKGKLRKTSDGSAVEFQLSMRLGCSK